MHFTAPSFVASLALLSQLAIALPAPQVTVIEVQTVTLQPGQSPPSPGPVVVANKMAVDDTPQRHYNHWRVHKVVKVNKNDDDDDDEDETQTWGNRKATTNENNEEQVQSNDTQEDTPQEPKPAAHTTSEDTTSEDTTSEDTSSEDTSSEDTNEDTSSEDTTSEDTNEDTSSEDTTNQETEDEEPAENSNSGSGPSDSLMQEVLELHNKYRADHGADPLVWDEALASHAVSDEESLGCGALTHSKDKSFSAGENLSMASPKLDADAVTRWYNEFKDWDFASGQATCGGDCMTGHFTQVVWKGSSKLGCALGCGGTTLRCQYQEPGNYGGRYQENVCPKGGC